MGIFNAMCLGAAISDSLGYDPARKAGMQAMFAEFDRQVQERIRRIDEEYPKEIAR